MNTFVHLITVTLLLISIGFFTACDNSLEPIDNDTGIYSFSGAIDLNKDTNHIRVRDLNVPFTAEASRNIDATVTLQNLSSGFTEQLQAERLSEDSVYHHNFEITQPIETNTPYQLTITRSDGEEVSSTITTPTFPTPVAEPINEQCYTPIDITFEPVFESTIAFFIEFHPQFLPRTRLGPYIIRNDTLSDNQAAIYTFRPVDLMHLIPGTLGRYRCTDLLEPQFEFYFSHYSPGFYEFIVDNPFNAFESTQRFGAFYRDTLIVPIDTARVCPPDCL